MAALATSGGGVSAPAAGAATASFRHPAYELVNGDRIERRADVPMPSTREGDEEEQRTVTEALVGYVTASMLSMGFKEHWIPDEEAPAKCPIYGTTNWHSAPRLLIVLINQVRAAHRLFLVQSVLLFAWFLSGRIGDYDVWGASEFLSMKLTHNFFFGSLFIFLLSFFTVATTTTTTTTTKWNSWAAFRRWEANRGSGVDLCASLRV